MGHFFSRDEEDVEEMGIFNPKDNASMTPLYLNAGPSEII